jgi:hypothetical protein
MDINRAYRLRTYHPVTCKPKYRSDPMASGATLRFSNRCSTIPSMTLLTPFDP